MLKLGPRYHLISVKPSGRQLAEVTRLVEDGRVRPVIDRTGTLDDIRSVQRNPGTRILQPLPGRRWPIMGVFAWVSAVLVGVVSLCPAFYYLRRS